MPCILSTTREPHWAGARARTPQLAENRPRGRTRKFCRNARIVRRRRSTARRFSLGCESHHPGGPTTPTSSSSHHAARGGSGSEHSYQGGVMPIEIMPRDGHDRARAPRSRDLSWCTLAVSVSSERAPQQRGAWPCGRCLPQRSRVKRGQAHGARGSRRQSNPHGSLRRNAEPLPRPN